MSKLSNALNMVNTFLAFNRYQLIVQPIDRGIYLAIETIRSKTFLFKAEGSTLDVAIINLAKVIDKR